MSRSDDDELLDRAMEVGHVLFTQDDDLLQEAARRQRRGRAFAGVMVRRTIEDLELIAKVCEQSELANRVVFLPLK